MHVYDLPSPPQVKETLDTTIDRDASTGLPLLSETPVIFDLITAYLALPYSVAEFGCGKKTCLILELLLRMKVPAFALERGMILEEDMSEEALAEADSRQRPGALTLENPLEKEADLRDPRLRALLGANYVHVSADGDTLHAGPFALEHRKRVQFRIARSHIFTIVWLWDEEARLAVPRIVDPTVDGAGLFPVPEMRQKLSAPGALLLTAPLLGRFRLDPEYLTDTQRRRVAELAPNAALLDMPYEEHARLVRELSGAGLGTIGDPLEWTYANNVPFGDAEHDARQRRLTGRGDSLREELRRLVDARETFARDLNTVRDDLDAEMLQLDIADTVKRDADLAEENLAPLADVANTVAYYSSLVRLDAWLEESLASTNSELLTALREPEEEMWGLGVSLRARLERLALVSEDEQGRIDARALNDRFIAATVETVRQMNRAGLEVFVDRVGNLHGLLLDEAARERLRRGEASVAELRKAAICHGSHIDTVEDAGKYDGRLGVLSGIEIAHVMRDLVTYFDRRLVEKPGDAVLQVTAFIGEEMTFTGEGVSMPGSAAVAGLAKPPQVHAMRNGDGELWRDRLLVLLGELRHRQAEAQIELHNRLDAVDFESEGWQLSLLEACSEPTDFMTPHSYERHIEQGPELDRLEVPLVLVDTIMGIHQEDVVFRGAHAEPAALELNVRCREALLARQELRGVRLTVGIVQELDDDRCFENPSMAQRWVIEGERNHAGSTAIEDRRDPGVAAARLARELRRLVAEHNDESGAGAKPLIGGVELDPGTSRNVIPGSAALKLGVEGEFSEEDTLQLSLALQAFLATTLSPPTADGGEGIQLQSVEPVSFLNTARKVLVSIDMRAESEAAMGACREEIESIVAEIEGEMGVEASTSVEQHVPPRPLADSGQVLQIERSYGGSHNPHEMELARDLVRGTVLQLAVTRDLLAARHPDELNLYEQARRKIPDAWRQRLPRFVSGALHDTCNISAATLAARSSREKENREEDREFAVG